MNFLLDTHTLIWSMLSPGKLSIKVKNNIKQYSSGVSVISLWEIALKYTIGKLDLQGVKPDELLTYTIKTGFEVLDLQAEIAATFYQLPKIQNKDPFDQLLAWQAIKGNFILLSKDKGFDDYQSAGLNRIW